MSNIDVVLADAHSAVDNLAALGEKSGGRWTTPPSPGKWSPSQIVEHVARALEESASLVSGNPTKFPRLPRLLRPIVKAVILNRILRGRRFPKAKTIEAFDPASGPATPAEGRARLEGAMAKFDRACRACDVSGKKVESTVFGRISVEDYARFQMLHARHHATQMTGT
jgi:hypothetical protein